MKKRNPLKPAKKVRNNPVAKHAPKFNKAGEHRVRTKYHRKNKHQQSQETP